MSEIEGVPVVGEGQSATQQTAPPAQTETAIPYARFKEVNDSKTKLEQELFIAQKQLADKAPVPTRSLDAREFAKLLNQGFSDDDITFVETVMKSTNKPANEVIELPHVKKALEATKADRTSQQATPAPSQPVSFGGIGRSGANPPSYFEGGKPTTLIPDEKKQTFQEWKAKRRAGR